MASCHPIILNDGGCDASVDHNDQETERHFEMNETSLFELGVPPTPSTNNCGTATRSRNSFGYFSKFAAVTIVAAYAVSSVSAFTQPKYQMGANTITRASSKWQPMSLVRSRVSSVTSPSLSPTTRLFMSAETESSASSKSDQKEWRAVFLALQLYKAAYGDLKVPARFVVPSAAPWPGM